MTFRADMSPRAVTPARCFKCRRFLGSQADVQIGGYIRESGSVVRVKLYHAECLTEAEEE